jgi:NAD(P)-dependent dehydrogenase (short-subunit alcohol dehydrogenase family)
MVDFQDINLSNVHSTFKSNILQMFAVTKFALPHLRRGASIINTTSVTAYKGPPALVEYTSTKGLYPQSRGAARAEGHTRQRRGAGPVVTALQPVSRTADNMEGVGVGLPLHRRPSQAAEMGPTFVYLASSALSNAMTGQIIHLNSEFVFYSINAWLSFMCRWPAYRRFMISWLFGLYDSNVVLNKTNKDLYWLTYACLH